MARPRPLMDSAEAVQRQEEEDEAYCLAAAEADRKPARTVRVAADQSRQSDEIAY